MQDRENVLTDEIKTWREKRVAKEMQTGSFSVPPPPPLHLFPDLARLDLVFTTSPLSKNLAQASLKDHVKLSAVFLNKPKMVFASIEFQKELTSFVI